MSTVVVLVVTVLVVCLIGHALDLHHRRAMARIRHEQAWRRIMQTDDEQEPRA